MVGELGRSGDGECDVVGLGEVLVQRPASGRGEGHGSVSVLCGAVGGGLGFAGPDSGAGGFEGADRDADLAFDELVSAGLIPVGVVEIDLVFELFEGPFDDVVERDGVGGGEQQGGEWDEQVVEERGEGGPDVAAAGGAGGDESEVVDRRDDASEVGEWVTTETAPGFGRHQLAVDGAHEAGGGGDTDDEAELRQIIGAVGLEGPLTDRLVDAVAGVEQ